MDVGELVSLIGEDVARSFGATPAGNWEGTNVLWLPDGSEPSSLDLSAARRTLFEAREARVRPGTDDKVLTAWNAMAITALAEAGRAFEEPRFIDAAEGCARFVLKNLRRADGRLLRSWREDPGRAGFCDDHALLASACLTLFSTTEESTGSAKRSCSWTRWWTCSSTRSAVASSRRDRMTIARPPTEGAVRQRRAVRELGGRRRPPASRAPLR